MKELGERTRFGERAVAAQETAGLSKVERDRSEMMKEVERKERASWRKIEDEQNAAAAEAERDRATARQRERGVAEAGSAVAADSTELAETMAILVEAAEEIVKESVPALCQRVHREFSD